MFKKKTDGGQIIQVCFIDQWSAYYKAVRHSAFAHSGQGNINFLRRGELFIYSIAQIICGCLVIKPVAIYKAPLAGYDCRLSLCGAFDFDFDSD